MLIQLITVKHDDGESWEGSRTSAGWLIGAKISLFKVKKKETEKKKEEENAFKNLGVTWEEKKHTTNILSDSEWKFSITKERKREKT